MTAGSAAFEAPILNVVFERSFERSFWGLQIEMELRAVQRVGGGAAASRPEAAAEEEGWGTWEGGPDELEQAAQQGAGARAGGSHEEWDPFGREVPAPAATPSRP